MKPVPRIVYTTERDRSNIEQHGRSLSAANLIRWDTAWARMGQLETRATARLQDGGIVVVSYRDTHDSEPVRRVNLLRAATPEEAARYTAKKG